MALVGCNSGCCSPSPYNNRCSYLRRCPCTTSPPSPEAVEPTNPPTPLPNSTSPPPALPPAIVVPPANNAPSSNSPPPSTNSTSPPPASPNGGLPAGKLALMVGTGIGGLIVLVGVCIFVTFYRKRKRRRLKQGPEGMSLGLSQSTFTYEELKTATDGFSKLNLLGEGGFGYVHKGVLPSGKVVAVKQLKAGSRQGDREFRTEVEIISRIHHRHLVSLVGYCISGAQRILVYEFVPNSTLEFHLHGEDHQTMAWPTRMKIALGAARGLAYLHEECNPKIIHRDIKAANILLESNFEAKVADFGLAKLVSDTDTHVSTRVMGTFGYLAPEYASSGNLTEKSDVFSFGVVLLELITGRRPVDRFRPFDEGGMVDWARPLLAQALEGDKFDAIVDPKLNNDYVYEEMTRIIACAASCIRHSARHRPSVTQVVRALEGNLSLGDLNEGLMPGHGRVYNRCESSDYDASQDQEDSKEFRMMAWESQEQATSEFSDPNSEHGLQPSSSSSGVQQTSQEMDLRKMAEDGHHASRGS